MNSKFAIIVAAIISLFITDAYAGKKTQDQILAQFHREFDNAANANKKEKRLQLKKEAREKATKALKELGLHAEEIKKLLDDGKKAVNEKRTEAGKPKNGSKKKPNAAKS